jgi:hypothetical protein
MVHLSMEKRAEENLPLHPKASSSEIIALSITPNSIPPYFDSMCVLASPSSQAFLITSI